MSREVDTITVPGSLGGVGTGTRSRAAGGDDDGQLVGRRHIAEAILAGEPPPAEAANLPNLGASVLDGRVGGNRTRHRMGRSTTAGEVAKRRSW